MSEYSATLPPVNICYDEIIMAPSLKEKNLGEHKHPGLRKKRLLNLITELMIQVHPHHRAPEHLTLDSQFETDLGLDSLARVELISRVESNYNLTLPERTLADVQTPRDLLRVLQNFQPSKPVHAPQAPPPEPHSTLKETIHPEEVETLVELLEWHTRRHGERLHIQLYQDDGNGEQITYGQLYRGALKVAGALQERGLEKAEPVAIMLPTGADYFYSFFGILLAGGIPVPLYPPARPTQIEEHIRRHVRILENCGAPILITLPEGEEAARMLKSLTPSLKAILTATELRSFAGEGIPPVLNGQDIAFLQYTSGSTGNPKGVILTHANLLANIRAMGDALDASSEDVFVSWLPLYHDMGLIGAWLGTLYFAAQLVIMSPLSFLGNPERWLRAIERHHGTLSAAPNFGYEYALHRLQDSDLNDLNLSSWRAAFNGAEAISPTTLEAFTEHFSAYGFDTKAMTPVYGLAESSVGVTIPPMHRGAVIDRIERETFMRRNKAVPAADEQTPALRFVSCGLPLKGHQIRVVDSAGKELPERETGRLEFRGPSSTSGYYRDAEKTRKLFDGEWLDTGDLAYIAEGELYVTGRIKDIIIRAGRNIYPDELEKAIGNLEGIRKGCVAIFGSTDPKSGTERLIILAETPITDIKECHRLRQRVNETASELIGTPSDEVVLAPPGSVLKTSSGKIRRNASRQMYEKGDIGQKRKPLLLQIARLALSALLPQLRMVANRIQTSLYALYGWTVFMTLSPFTWLGIVAAPNERLRWKVVQKSARLLAKWTRTPLTIQQAENLAAIPERCVLVANHASYLDAFVMGAAIDKPFGFVAKAELGEQRLLRLPLEKLDTELIERSDISQTVADAQRLSENLKTGQRLLFFAEGTFSRIPGLQPFHLGAFTAAAEAGVPVVPVVIRGTRSILRAGSWFPHHGAITVTVGEPIEPDASLPTDDPQRLWEEALALRSRARQFILDHCGEPDLTH